MNPINKAYEEMQKAKEEKRLREKEDFKKKKTLEEQEALKKSTRKPDDILKEYNLQALRIGNKHYLIELNKEELKRDTVKLHELSSEYDQAILVHGKPETAQTAGALEPKQDEGPKDATI